MIGLDDHSLVDLAYGHRRAAAENVGHEALVLRREMLDDDVRHARVGGGGPEEGTKRIDAASRGADAHHREGQPGARTKIDWCRGFVRRTGGCGRECASRLALL